VLKRLLLEADDRYPARDRKERAVRRLVVASGRASIVAMLPVFAGVSGRERRIALLGVVSLHAIHVPGLLRLHGLYRDRAKRYVPIAGAAHGLVGYVALAALLHGDATGHDRQARAAEGYMYVGLLVDLLDGALRRRRPARAYVVLAAGMLAAAAVRVAPTREPTRPAAALPARELRDDVGGRSDLVDSRDGLAGVERPRVE